MRSCLLAAVLIVLAGAAGGAQTLRVLTINVWSGLDYRGYLKMGEYQDAAVRDRRTEVLLQELKALKVDIVGLNEANKLPAYARRLARSLGAGRLGARRLGASRLGYDSIYHVGVGGVRVGPLGLPVNLREGDVILARKALALGDGVREQLSGGPVGNFFTFHFADATQVIGGRIRVAGRELYVFNTHWHASLFATDQTFELLAQRRAAGLIDERRHDELVAEAVEGAQWRLAEAHRTVAFVNRVAGDSPVVLMGDFNAESGSEEIAVLTAAGFKDAFAEVGRPPGYTWDGLTNGNIRLQKRVHPEDFWLEPTRKRIDYIFFRGEGLEALSCKVVFDRPVQGLYPSDHFGVVTDFQLRP